MHARLPTILLCFAFVMTAAAAPPEAAPPRVDYVMVAPRAYQDSLTPLVAFHEHRGHHVARLVLEDVLAQAPEAPAEGVIRDAIARLDGEHGRALEFVLLVGDPDPGPGADAPPLPAFRSPKLPYAGMTTDFPTDFPYGILPGPPEGGAPRILAVGRFPARTRAEVERMVEKTIGYSDDASGDWQRRLALFGGPANFTPFLDGLIESEAERLLSRAIPYDFDLSFVFAKTDSPYTWRPDELSTKLAGDISAGALISAYFGHGMPRAFDLVEFRDRYYPIGDVDSLTTVSVTAGKPLFVALACDIGAYDQEGGELSLGEVLFQNPRGPVAVVSSSRESHPYANALYARALIDVFLAGRAPSIGQGLAAVKATARDHRFALAEMLVNVDVQALLDEHAGLYNLLGDPALVLRYPRAAPVSLSVPDNRGGVDALRTPGGSAVHVAVSGHGETTVTLETERATIREPLESLAGLEREDAFRAMVRNWARATDKVVTRVVLPAGVDAVTLTAPEAPGQYVVKIFERGASPAAGFARLEISGEVGAASRTSEAELTALQSDPEPRSRP